MAKGTGALSTKCTLKIDNSIFFNYNIYLVKYNKKPPSSRGLGHLPFTEKTRIRIPLGVIKCTSIFAMTSLVKLIIPTELLFIFSRARK